MFEKEANTAESGRKKGTIKNIFPKISDKKIDTFEN